MPSTTTSSASETIAAGAARPTAMTGSTPAAGSAPSSSAVVEVSPRQADEWLRAGQAVLIDVREPDEHARERIAGARPMALSKFDAAAAIRAVGPGQKLVLHCKGGVRSADAARRVLATGGTGLAVSSLRGGIEAWKKDGLPVMLDTRVPGLSIMRQVQLVVGLGVLFGSALAWFVHAWFLAIPAFLGAGLAFAGATGTCALASLLAVMPWNRRQTVANASSCCAGGTCA